MIFKAYDVRGIYPDQIDEKLYYKIGKAFVKLIKEETGKDKLTLVVGKDMRTSSPQLFNLAASVLAAILVFNRL